MIRFGDVTQPLVTEQGYDDSAAQDGGRSVGLLVASGWGFICASAGKGGSRSFSRERGSRSPSREGGRDGERWRDGERERTERERGQTELCVGEGGGFIPTNFDSD